MNNPAYTVHPIGRVHKKDGRVWIEIKDAYREAMLGLEGFSHVHVFYWFHENDNDQSRSMMQVRPRRDPKNPLTGVFATHSPHRPNLIALTLCRILKIDDLNIEIEKIDAKDGSPVIDIKCYIPYSVDAKEIQVPDWV
ncbi:MAG: tRNA (N6-threonylcarbamoyladenosine(37)-N6)-methyltransferase TrmO [Desulfobacterales bacterium]|nr:tRNA (N6-threonylcarbamoyladenosine(37)-N6)-methyltransferase TrmO [Desulfobacterales bacterium]